MSDKATFQEQQLVILAMAEGFIKKSDPEVGDIDIGALVSLWSDLIPTDYADMAGHLMTACTMVGYLLWEHFEDTNDAVAEYRDRILAAEGGLLGHPAADTDDLGFDDDCDCGDCE